jgi:hypothetical protein
VVARRDHVGACLEQSGRELGGQPDAVGRVLPVHDAKVSVELVPELGETIGHRPAPGRSEDVADEEQLQRARI